MDEVTIREAFAKEFNKDYLDMLDNKSNPTVSNYVYLAFAHGFNTGKEHAVYQLVDKVED